ncbi:MAG: hypothetical protein ABW137_27435 [Mycobacterium sp.]
MQENKIRGPLISLAAVAALGGGLWLANVSQENDAAPPAPVVQSTTLAAPAPPNTPAPTTTPPPVAFPAKANYEGDIPTRSGTITLQIAVDGAEAVAYACDGYDLESWLRGPARDGALSLSSADGTGRLEGRLDGASVVGTLWIGEKKWDFTAAPVATPPAWAGNDGIA